MDRLHRHQQRLALLRPPHMARILALQLPRQLVPKFTKSLSEGLASSSTPLPTLLRKSATWSCSSSSRRTTLWLRYVNYFFCGIEFLADILVQSSFATPCRSLTSTSTSGQVGFDSGFMPVADGVTTFPTWNITVNDTTPIWAYCRQVRLQRTFLIVP